MSARWRRVRAVTPFPQCDGPSCNPVGAESLGDTQGDGDRVASLLPSLFSSLPPSLPPCAGAEREQRALTAPRGAEIRGAVPRLRAGREGGGRERGDPPRLRTVTIPANLRISGGNRKGMSGSHCLC